MNCVRFFCTCECGSYAQPLSLWLTDEKILLITARCIACEKEVNSLFRLADLVRACPPPDLDKLSEEIGKEIALITDGEKPLLFNEEDMRFLHALKIGDENES